MSNSEEVVVAGAVDVPDILPILIYHEILSEFLLLQRKHSEHMYAKCLKFSCFSNKNGCMHAFILHVLSARLTKVFTVPVITIFIYPLL